MGFTTVLLVFAGSGLLLLALAVLIRRRKSAVSEAAAAVHAYRTAARRNAARFAPALADSLHVYSVELAEAGKLTPALEAAMEAADLFRALAQSDSAAGQGFAARLSAAAATEDEIKKALNIVSAADLDAHFASIDAEDRTRRRTLRHFAALSAAGWGIAFWVVSLSLAAFGLLAAGVI